MLETHSQNYRKSQLKILITENQNSKIRITENGFRQRRLRRQSGAFDDDVRFVGVTLKTMSHLFVPFQSFLRHHASFILIVFKDIMPLSFQSFYKIHHFSFIFIGFIIYIMPLSFS
jgi:hypothetical protein